MSGNQRPSIHPQQPKTQTKSNTYMSTMINYCRNCPMARNSRKHILTCPSYGHP